MGAYWTEPFDSHSIPPFRGTAAIPYRFSPFPQLTQPQPVWLTEGAPFYPELLGALTRSRLTERTNAPFSLLRDPRSLHGY